jgi:hypothetical protein
VQRPGGGEDLVEEAEAVGAERGASRPVAEPVRVGALDPAADRLGSLENLGIENEFARGVGTEEDVAGPQARQVDVW